MNNLHPVAGSLVSTLTQVKEVFQKVKEEQKQQVEPHKPTTPFEVFLQSVSSQLKTVPAVSGLGKLTGIGTRFIESLIAGSFPLAMLRLVTGVKTEDIVKVIQKSFQPHVKGTVFEHLLRLAFLDQELKRYLKWFEPIARIYYRTVKVYEQTSKVLQTTVGKAKEALDMVKQKAKDLQE